MKKNGFMLSETLIVTAFVSGVLLFLFIQFNNLANNYSDSYSYNTVENIYSLENIREYIFTDNKAIEMIKSNVNEKGYLDVSDCDIFTNKDYCIKLFELESIEEIFITVNKVDGSLIYTDDLKFEKFINKINEKGTENYRLIASFKDSTYATLRFGANI